MTFKALALNSVNGDLQFAVTDVDAFNPVDQKPGLFRKQLIYVGSFKKKEQRFTITEQDIDHWVATHPLILAEGAEVPLPVEHSTSPEACRGFVEGLEKAPDAKGRVSLFGYIRFSKPEYENLAASSQVSIYVPPVDEINGKPFVRPVRHVALTNYPVITGLDKWTAIACSFSEGEIMKELMIAIAALLGFELPAEGEPTQEEFVELAKKALEKKEPEKEPESKKVVDPSIAASNVSALLLSTTRDLRHMKIDALVAAGKINGAQAKALKTQYAEDGVLKLSLADGAGPDGFDNQLMVLSMNSSQFSVAEKSSGQHEPQGGDSDLVKNAQKRAERRAARV